MPSEYRFLSAPDFLNADIADLRRTPGWRPGKPNSSNAAWQRAMNTVLDTFVDEDPADVLVAGDLVNGHWGQDTRRTGLFGPVKTTKQMRAAVKRAARPYYKQWVQRFAQRGMTPHVAVGDHELGDNPWAGKPYPEFKRNNLDLFKREFARHALRPQRYNSRPPGPANRTAYATRLHNNVTLVTVDVFQRARKDVRIKLDPQQLRWFDRVLTAAQGRGDWLVVQGHVPVAGPVAKYGSSGLTYEGGTRSPFWRTMARHGVDMYLNGEVHDITVLQADGITQISHGGRLGSRGRDGGGNQSYLVADFIGDQVDLRINRFRPSAPAPSSRLWQTIKPQQPPLMPRIAPDPPCLGTLTLTNDQQTLTSSGRLAPRSARSR